MDVMRFLLTVRDDLEHLDTLKDGDAKIGHKIADTSFFAFFGYKTHIAMTKERIITAATITSGEKTDGKELAALVQKSREAGMGAVGGGVTYQCDYTANGQLRSKSSSEKSLLEYAYDRMNRLAEAVYNGEKEQFSHDLAGNRLKKVSGNQEETYYYNARTN